MEMPDFQRYPWNLNLITNGEDIVVFLTRKVFSSDIFYMYSIISKKNVKVNFPKKKKLQINQLFKESKKNI